MTPDGFMALQALFGSAWTIFTGWKIPGTNTTPAAFLMAILFIAMVVRNIGRIFQIATYIDGVDNFSGKEGK